MEQQKELDNPHMIESRLGYLAAMIDGEGCVTLDRSGRRRLAGVMGLQPKVVITNTNEAIVGYVVGVIKELGLNPHIKKQVRSGHLKTCYWVTVSGLVKTKKLLEIVMPYMVGKRTQAQLLLDFIAYRGDSQLAKGKPYGDVELGILRKIRALNFRGMSETEDYELGQKLPS